MFTALCFLFRLKFNLDYSSMEKEVGQTFVLNRLCKEKTYQTDKEYVPVLIVTSLQFTWGFCKDVALRLSSTYKYTAFFLNFYYYESINFVLASSPHHRIHRF